MGAGTSAAAGSAATGELGIADLSGAGASIRDTGVSPPLPAFGITILAASDLLSLEGLTSSVEGFEATHPRLVQIVNSISTILANMGI